MREKMSNTLNRRHFIQSLLIFFGAGASIKSKLIFASKPDKNLKEKEEKVNAVTKRRLSAPCGLDCFNCEIYEENITGGKLGSSLACARRSWRNPVG